MQASLSKYFGGGGSSAAKTTSPSSVGGGGGGGAGAGAAASGAVAQRRSRTHDAKDARSGTAKRARKDLGAETLKSSTESSKDGVSGPSVARVRAAAAVAAAAQQLGVGGGEASVRVVDAARHEAFVNRLLGDELDGRTGVGEADEWGHDARWREPRTAEAANTSLAAFAASTPRGAAGGGTARSEGGGVGGRAGGNSSSYSRNVPAAAASSARGASSYTPLEQQVLDIKRANPGVLLMVECGYKYRFFGEDAVAASRVLGIVCYQKKAFMNASVPVHRVGVHVRRLVGAGYKVGVVKQTETAALKAAGDNRRGPFSRGLVGLYSRGTLVGDSILGGDAAPTASDGDAASHTVAEGARQYLMALFEEPVPVRSRSPGGADGGVDRAGEEAEDVRVAVVAVDVATGDGVYDAFTDTALRRGLESRLRHLDPVELLLPATGLSPTTETVLKEWLTADGGAPDGPLAESDESDVAAADAGDATDEGDLSHTDGTSAAASGGSTMGGMGLSNVVRVERLSVDWFSRSEALAAIHDCFEDRALDSEHPGDHGSVDDGVVVDGAVQLADDRADCSEVILPRLLAPLRLGLLHARALGALARHLQAFRLTQVLRAVAFRPFGSGTHMRLSGATLHDLEILRSQATLTEHGSLLWVLHHTLTPFGFRLLVDWVRHPLADPDAIVERQDAVETLVKGPAPACVSGLLAVMRGLPDLERSLARIIQCASSPEEVFATLTHFRRICEAFPSVSVVTDQVGPGLLRNLLAALPDVRTLVDDALAALNAGALSKQTMNAPAQRSGGSSARGRGRGRGGPFWARKAGAAVASAAKAQEVNARDRETDLFTPAVEKALFPDILEVRAGLRAMNGKFDDELQHIRTTLKLPRLEFRSLRVGMSAELEYLVEVKHSDAARAPADWLQVRPTKSVMRFHTPRVLDLIQELELLRERLIQEVRKAWTVWLEGLGKKTYAPLRGVVSSLAKLDCIASLATTAKLPGYVRPEISGFASKPFLEVRNARHPMVDLAGASKLALGALDAGPGAGGSYVPSDIMLGGTQPHALVLSGPNMGGKSSYARMAATVAIMAQIGSFVPAEAARIGVFDAVFTRTGATDDITAGMSTFLVEMSQTAEILRHATPRSFLLLDELGRGTATHDGCAIAYGVLRHVVERLRCVTLFVTHYPELCEVADENPTAVKNGHMSFLTSDGSHETEGDVATQHQPVVTFLYKLADGPAGRSYGLNVARLAGVPSAVLRRAATLATEMEGSAAR